MKINGLICKFLLLLAALIPSAICTGAARAAEESVRQKAETIINSSEAIATGYRAYGKKHKQIVDVGIGDLIKGDFLKEYPKTTHPQSDFYSTPDSIDEGGGAAYYVRYSISEPAEVELCKALNEIRMKLRHDALISSAGIVSSSQVPGGIAFSPTPVEIVGKESFCLRIENRYEYFHRVTPVNR